MSKNHRDKMNNSRSSKRRLTLGTLDYHHGELASLCSELGITFEPYDEPSDNGNGSNWEDIKDIIMAGAFYVVVGLLQIQY